MQTQPYMGRGTAMSSSRNYLPSCSAPALKSVEQVINKLSRLWADSIDRLQMFQLGQRYAFQSLEPLEKLHNLTLCQPRHCSLKHFLRVIHFILSHKRSFFSPFPLTYLGKHSVGRFNKSVIIWPPIDVQTLSNSKRCKRPIYDAWINRHIQFLFKLPLELIEVTTNHEHSDFMRLLQSLNLVEYAIGRNTLYKVINRFPLNSHDLGCRFIIPSENQVGIQRRNSVNKTFVLHQIPKRLLFARVNQKFPSWLHMFTFPSLLEHGIILSLFGYIKFHDYRTRILAIGSNLYIEVGRYYDVTKSQENP